MDQTREASNEDILSPHVSSFHDMDQGASLSTTWTGGRRILDSGGRWHKTKRADRRTTHSRSHANSLQGTEGDRHRFRRRRQVVRQGRSASKAEPVLCCRRQRQECTRSRRQLALRPGVGGKSGRRPQPPYARKRKRLPTQGEAHLHADRCLPCRFIDNLNLSLKPFEDPFCEENAAHRFSAHRRYLAPFDSILHR